MDGKKFNTPQEEIAYWRDSAQNFKQELEETREELEEFQISSRELEQELEAQITQSEKKNSNLEQENDKLHREVETLRSKLETLQAQSHKRIDDLENDLMQTTAFKDELQKYIRELEQANDDLERAKRATVVSLEDFETRLNQAIERNAFLESELDEKESMTETVQRLKDEARDLRQELDVRETKPEKLGSPTMSPVTTPTNNQAEIDKRLTANNNNNNVTSGKADSNHVDPMNITPSKGIPSMNGGTPLTPSARISALNIVGDLLRKVGALETKLASCRNYVKDPPPGSTARSMASPARSPKTKRMTRQAVVHPQQNVKIPV